jgi:hypothetical protein
VKIRSGFVSNSSSASFMIKTGPSDPLLRLAMEVTGQKQKAVTVYEVACEMLRASSRNRTLHELKKVKGNYDYIEFPSINEETCIYYDDEDPSTILITTFNNESQSWDSAMDIIRTLGVEEIIESGESYNFSGFVDSVDKRKLKITEWEDPYEDETGICEQ